MIGESTSGVDVAVAAARPRIAPPGGWGTLFAASGIFLVATLAMFGDVLFTSRGLVVSKAHEDLFDIFVHWQTFGFTELRKGNLPLWNPHVFSGAPFFGGFQPALLYPPNWLGLILSPAKAINVGVALHIFLAGLWTYLWASYRRLHPAACVFAGFVFMFCGAHFLQIYRGHLPNLRTVSWAPLVLLVADGLVQTGGRSWLLLGTVVVALQLLAGHVQEFFYTFLIVGSYVTLCALSTSGQARGDVASGRVRVEGLGTRGRARPVFGLGAIYAGAACLAAVQLLTGLDAISECLRTDLEWKIARTFAFPPENVLTLIVPGLFGDMIRQPYWGRWTLSEMSLFIGTAPFLCVVHAVRHGDKARRRFACTLALVALILAFGYYTPLHRFLYDYVPGFGGFRGTTKFTFLASVFLAMLAGVGLDRLLTHGERPPRERRAGLPERGTKPAHEPSPASTEARFATRVAICTFVLLLVGAVAIALSVVAGPDGTWGRLLASIDPTAEGYKFYPVDRGGDFFARAGRHTATSMLIAAASFAVLAALFGAARRRRAAIYAIALLGGIELFTYARYSRPTFDLAPILEETEALKGLLRRTPGDYRILSHNPYLAMSSGALDLYGFDPMMLARYAEFLARAQEMEPDDLIVTRMGRVVPLLGMLRLRYTFRADGRKGHALFTDLRELPRALLVPTWRVETDKQARLATLVDQAFDPKAVVLLEDDPGLGIAAATPPPNAGELSPSGSISVVDVSSDILEIRAETPAPAILLLTDNYSAGWKVASISESPRQDYAILPADHTLRGIPLTAGAHHLRLEYRPTAFVVGSWVTLFSLAAYGLAMVAVWRSYRASTTRSGAASAHSST